MVHHVCEQTGFDCCWHNCLLEGRARIGEVALHVLFCFQCPSFQEFDWPSRLIEYHNVEHFLITLAEQAFVRCFYDVGHVMMVTSESAVQLMHSMRIPDN